MTSLGEVLFRFMNMYKDRTAQIMVETDERDTFGAMLERSISTASKLRELGFAEGDIVSSCMYNSKDSCIPSIASWFIGAIPAAFDPDLPKLDAVSLLKLLQPRIIFVDEESLSFMEQCIDIANTGTKIVVTCQSPKYDSFDEFLFYQPRSEAFKVSQIKSDRDTALIIFSSGTTGPPKGICWSHYGIIKLMEDYIMKAETIFNNNPIPQTQDQLLSFPTLYGMTPNRTLIQYIIEGNIRLICPKFDPVVFWATIQKYKIGFLYVLPFWTDSLTEHKPPELTDVLTNIKLIGIGSCNVTKNNVKKLMQLFPQTPIMSCYSQTEVAQAINIYWINSYDDLQLDSDKPLTVGKFVDNYRNAWKVVDPETEQVLGPNREGELRIKSEITFSGYYKMDSSNCFDSEGYLKTGDLCFYDEDQYLYIIDRIREMFKFRSCQVVPFIIEAVLMDHPAVQEAAVVGIPHPADGYHPAAVVVLRKDHLHVTPREIEEFVASQVSEVQKLRGGVVITDIALPRTATLKLMRREILNIALKLRKQ